MILNFCFSRCSVLAAANGALGRWDETSTKNLNLMPTILSRFLLPFKDAFEKKWHEDIKIPLNYTF